MSIHKYQGDLGEYPFFSLQAIPKHFPDQYIVYSTNAISQSGRKGVFVAGTKHVGFISYTLFGKMEEYIDSLSNVRVSRQRMIFVYNRTCLVFNAPVNRLLDFNMVVDPLIQVGSDQWLSLYEAYCDQFHMEDFLILTSPKKDQFSIILSSENKVDFVEGFIKSRKESPHNFPLSQLQFTRDFWL